MIQLQAEILKQNKLRPAEQSSIIIDIIYIVVIPLCHAGIYNEYSVNKMTISIKYDYIDYEYRNLQFAPYK